MKEGKTSKLPAGCNVLQIPIHLFWWAYNPLLRQQKHIDLTRLKWCQHLILIYDAEAVFLLVQTDASVTASVDKIQSLLIQF
jgi:hypothetical protein